MKISTNAATTLTTTAWLATSLLAEATKLGPVISPNEGIVMPKATVYPIYFGQWDAARIAKVQQFLADIGKSKWFGTDKAHYQLESLSLGQNVVIPSNETRLDQFDFGSAIAENDFWFTGLKYDPKTSENQVLAVIHDAIESGKVPADENGIYMLMPSADVDVLLSENTSTWSDACSFHDYFTSESVLGGKPVKYGVIPDVEGCSWNEYLGTKPTTGDAGLDNIAESAYSLSVMMMTDPTGRGWYVSDESDQYYHSQAPDLCADHFGLTCTDKSGAQYNAKIGGVKYLLPTSYDPKARMCKTHDPIVPEAGEHCKLITADYYSQSSSAAGKTSWGLASLVTAFGALVAVAL